MTQRQEAIEVVRNPVDSRSSQMCNICEERRGERLRTVLIFISISMLGFLVFLRVWHNGFILVFQDRDISRAMKILEGQPIFYGPETSGGGVLPGPGYYYLLAGSLAIFRSWISTWYLMIGLAALGGGITFLSLRRHFNSNVALIGLGSYLIAPGLWGTFSCFFNPSYLPFFLSVQFLLLLELESDRRPRQQMFCWVSFCFLSGFCWQLHASALTIFAAGVLRRLSKSNKFTWNFLRFMVGAISFTLPLLPYLIWRFANGFGVHLGQALLTYVGKSASSLPVILENMNDVMEMIGSSSTHPYLAWTDYISKRIFTILPQSTPYIIACSIIFARTRKKKNDHSVSSSTNTEDENKVLLLKLCAWMSFLFSASINFIYEPGIRYVITFSTAVAWFLAAATYQMTKEGDNKKLLILMGSMAFVTLPESIFLKFTCLVLAIGFFYLYESELGFGLRFSLRQVIDRARLNKSVWVLWILFSLMIAPAYFYNSKPMGIVPSQDDLVTAAEYIHQVTGWSWAQARDRMFFYGLLRSVSMREPYLELEGKIDPYSNKRPNPSGIIVFMRKKIPDLTRDSVIQFFASSFIEKKIKDGIKNGSIEFGSPHQLRRLAMIPYYVKDPFLVQPYFNNRGLNYEDSEEVSKLEALPDQPSTIRTDHSVLVFKNFCDEKPNYGRVAFELTKSGKQDQSSYNLRIYGRTISQPSHWIIPECTISFRRIRAKFVCTEAKASVLAYNLGFRALDYRRSIVNMVLGP